MCIEKYHLRRWFHKEPKLFNGEVCLPPSNFTDRYVYCSANEIVVSYSYSNCVCMNTFGQKSIGKVFKLGHSVLWIIICVRLLIDSLVRFVEVIHTST